MSAPWNPMVERLRDEVTGYGRLLQLFEEQQMLLFRRDAGGVLRVSDMIEEQARVLEECRRSREQATADLAASHSRPVTSTVRSLLPVVAAEARPLIDALVTEVNKLVDRVRRISRHNRIFLLKTIENHQEMIGHLRPGAYLTTYSKNGRLAAAGVGCTSALAVEG